MIDRRGATKARQNEGEAVGQREDKEKRERRAKDLLAVLSIVGHTNCS